MSRKILCNKTKKRIFYTEEAVKMFIKDSDKKLWYYICLECKWYHLTKHNIYKFNFKPQGEM